MFAVMMIPHHQQAIDMSSVALSNPTASAEVKNLAQRIIDGQTPEIALMEGWLDDSEHMRGMPPSGEEMPMGGMASPEEMENLATLEGQDFDTQFLELMITHHEGALQMVHMIEDSALEGPAQLAQDIIRVQTAEIKEMKELLSSDTDS